MKASELPEAQKYYELQLSSGKGIIVNGAQKEGILNSQGNFIKLPNGSVVNKAFIVQIEFSHDETVSRFKAQ